jgi:hypothetical protein
VYASLAAVSGVTQLVRTVVVCFSGIRTAQAYYRTLMCALMQAPLAFFETTPQVSAGLGFRV